MLKALRILLLMLVMVFPVGEAVAQLQWRETTREPRERSLTDPRATDGTPRRIQVRVFTILGQSVSQATIGPGTVELKIGARGIYIVKIGNLTQKVAL